MALISYADGKPLKLVVGLSRQNRDALLEDRPLVHEFSKLTIPIEGRLMVAWYSEAMQSAIERGVMLPEVTVCLTREEIEHSDQVPILKESAELEVLIFGAEDESTMEAMMRRASRFDERTRVLRLGYAPGDKPPATN